MKIQTFRNKKGLIHGPDPKRIDCDREGILKVGNAEITVVPGGESIMPVLFYGATGEYAASFTDAFGEVFDLGRITVRGGRIVPPSDTAVELMELRCGYDEVRLESEQLKKKVTELEGIFDTDPLYFLT